MKNSPSLRGSSSLMAVLLLLLFATAFPPLQADDECPGKQSWPELLGRKAKKAELIIESQNPKVNATLIPEGTFVIQDFRCDRVWVFYNSHGLVIKTPSVG